MSQKKNPYVINSPPSSGTLKQRFGPLHQSQREGFNSYRNYNSAVVLPRLLNRNFPFHQSKNQIASKNVNTEIAVTRLLVKDWFHVFLRQHMLKNVTFLLVLWTVVILLFAIIYVEVDAAYLEYNCGLGEPGTPIEFGTAFAFSLETCTTVGCKLNHQPCPLETKLCMFTISLFILQFTSMCQNGKYETTCAL